MEVPECKGGVTAAVVKLNTLTNPVGAPTQDQHLGLISRHGLTLPIIRAVHVRRRCLKLSCTCVYTLVGRLHLQLLTLDPHLLLLHTYTTSSQSITALQWLLHSARC